MSERRAWPPGAYGRALHLVTELERLAAAGVRAADPVAVRWRTRLERGPLGAEAMRELRAEVERLEVLQ